MLQWLLELLLGVVLYGVLVYYVFLYSSADDDDGDGDNANSRCGSGVYGYGNHHDDDDDGDDNNNDVDANACLRCRVCNSSGSRSHACGVRKHHSRSSRSWLLCIVTTYLFGHPCNGWTPRRRAMCCRRHDRARRRGGRDGHARAATTPTTSVTAHTCTHAPHECGGAVDMSSNSGSRLRHHRRRRGQCACGGGGDVDVCGSDVTRTARCVCGAALRSAGGGTLRGETAQWLNVVVRYAALLALGGGSVQPRVWQQRCRRHVEAALHAVSAASEAARQRRLRAPSSTATAAHDDSSRHHHHDACGGGSAAAAAARPLALLRALELGACGHGNTAASRHGDGTRTTVATASAAAAATTTTTSAVGIVLPRVVGHVHSTETPAADNNNNNNNNNNNEAVHTGTLRCFAFRLVYEDAQFVLRMTCAVPLLWLLPPQLRISADALSLDGDVAVRHVVCDGVVHAALCGATLEVCFATAPHVDVVVDVTPPSEHARRSSSSSSNSHIDTSTSTYTLPLPRATTSGGVGVSERVAKTRELARRSLQRAVQSLTYPHVLQCCPVRDAPCGWRLQWRKATATLPRDAFVSDATTTTT